MILLRTALAPAIALALLWSVAAPVEAEDVVKPVQAEVLVVLAKEEAGKIDPQLEKLTPLRRPPFNAFRSMSLISKPKVTLNQGKDAVVALPNGRRLKLELQRVMPDGRYRIKVAINRPNKADYLPLLQVIASPGDPFFVAGQAYQGGTLVVGVKILPDPPPPPPAKTEK